MATNITQTAAGSKLREDLEQMIRDGLDDIGNGYNSLEDRVYRIEKNTGRSDVPQTIMQRLVALESRTLPYEQQACDAVVQFKDAVSQNTTMKERIKTLQTDNSDYITRIANLSKRFNDVESRSQDSQTETNAMIQRLINRVNVLERKTLHSPDGLEISPFTPAQDLAEALLARLKSGDDLEARTIAQLKRAIGSSRAVDARPVAPTAPTSFPDTPSTDQEPAAQTQKPSSKRKRAGEQEAPSKPVKRSKPPAKEAAAAPSSSAPVKKSQPVPARQQSASPRGKKVPSASAPTSTTTSFAPDEVPDSSQLRRTSREAKPTKRANYTTWLEVKAARKSSSQ